MLTTHDALQAHARCKTRISACFAKGQGSIDPNCLTPNPDCALVRFLDEAENVSGSIPEIAAARAAHATVHSVTIGLAQKRKSGRRIDVGFEFGSTGNFGSASSSLVSSLWKLEKKLHTMAG